jgi:Gp157 protein
MQLQMEADGVTKLKDAFITIWLQQSPPSIEVVDEAAVPAEFKRATLKLPLSQVPPSLLGLVQTCDVDRAQIQGLLKSTGELPAGITFRRGDRHLRIR